MMNRCANPNCGKPLHYLREGRIFVFDVADPKPPTPTFGRRTHHQENFWLCGACSATMVLEETSERQIRVARPFLAQS
jgi:hypothetical protein